MEEIGKIKEKGRERGQVEHPNIFPVYFIMEKKTGITLPLLLFRDVTAVLGATV